MNIKKFGFLGLSLVLLASACFAAGISSESFKIDQYLINAGGLTTGAGTLETTCSIGDATIVSMSTPSGSYSGSAGFQSTLTTIATLPVSLNVKIENVSCDGKLIANNDYIQPNAVLSAEVSASGAIIDINNSRILIDNRTPVTFASLAPPSGYVGKVLTYHISPNLSDGTHTITIEARDQHNNFNSRSFTLNVDTGALKATSVNIYPNPYNPNSGVPARIAYNLNKDGNTSIYIFNAIGELVYRQDYPNDRAGYVEQLYDGRDFAGNLLANDVYFLRVVSGGKVIGKCKIAILK